MDTSNSPFAAASHPPAGGSSNNSENIDLGHYVRLLLHNKWKIMIFVFVITSIVIAMVKPMRSVYRAETTVMIETTRPNIVQIESLYGANTRNREYMATQYEIIRSRNLIEQVIDRLNLVRHPAFDPRQQEEKKSLFSFLTKNKEQETEYNDEEIDIMVKLDLIDTFRSSLIVEPLYGTHLVRIGFITHNPDVAAEIANAMADVYIESHLESKLAVTKKATSWLSDRLGELRKNLQESEERLQNYKEEEQLVDVQGVRTLDSAELTQLREDYVDARQARAAAENLYRQVRDYKALSTDQILAIPAVLNNSIIQRLIEQKSTADRRVAELGKRYGPKHPNMLAAVTEQREIDQELDTRLVTVTQSIYADYQAAQRTEQGLLRQINSTQNRLQSVSRKEVRLRELEREVETNRQLYDLFLSRGKETDEASRLEEPPARIIDPAVAPIHPVGPDKKKFVIAAFIFSGAFICGLLILLDLLDSTVRTSDDVEHKLHMPMLGFLPQIKKNKSQYAFRAFAESGDATGFTEAIRSIRTSLILSSLDRPFETLVVTSSIQSEGKSTVAVNLAEALGQMEKVLLIDADMRRPSMARVLGMPGSTLGLSNIITGKAKLEDCIHRLPNSEIDVILAGTIPGNPLELLGSKQFKELLTGLKKQYDRIVVDSAPVHVVSDAKILASQADTLVYVVKSNSTPLSIANKGLKLLRSVNAPVSGVILNSVDIDKSSQYDSYYSIYKQHYGYVTNETA